MDEIASWRNLINEIDSQLLMLLNERAACAVTIGKIKQSKGIEIYNPDREKRVIENITKSNKGPLGNDTVQRLFEQIITECRSIESDEQS